MVQLQIDTGEAQPKKQPKQKKPLVVTQEVAQQLKKIQQAGVIKLSSRPWFSPAVTVRKKMEHTAFV